MNFQSVRVERGGGEGGEEGKKIILQQNYLHNIHHTDKWFHNHNLKKRRLIQNTQHMYLITTLFG